MAVTIQRLSSTVTVGEGRGGGGADGPLDPQAVEQIVAVVMARLKEEQRHEQRLRSEMSVPERMSGPTTA